MKPLLPDKLKNLKTALTHDDLTQYGGGERVFLAVKEIFPTASIYTSLVTGEWIRRLGGRRPYTSFMQLLPFKRRLQRAYFLLYPLAFESLDLSDFDLVISSSTRFAHGIITKPETKHVCYMHSPGRMFWEPWNYFGEAKASERERASIGEAKASERERASIGEAKASERERASIGEAKASERERASIGDRSRLKSLLSPALSYFRLWDYAAAQRVDFFIAGSSNASRKIKKYYHREAKVVYPFVDLEKYPIREAQTGLGDYYLVVSRLNRWKRIETAIKVINRLNLKLKIVGDGPDRRRLESLGNGKLGSRIKFLGWVSEDELAKLYQNCTALIMTQEEDFGIVSLEAQASGKPVIAYKAGGALETVRPGRTGEFFYPQTTEALAATLKRFEPRNYDPRECRKNAERFGKEKFQQKFLKEVVKAISD